LDALEQAGIGADRLAALTLTNQRETAVLWDRVTGEPAYNAIVWQCQRTETVCAELKGQGHEENVSARTGLKLDPYFSAAKWAWMLDNAPGARESLAEGRLLAGTMDSWLVWKLTDGRVHATDYTNASRTSLFNIHTLQWDEEMCALFGVPSSLLPAVKFSDEVLGHTDPAWLGASVPIAGIIGDSQAALFGNLCLTPGAAKATYGTGTSVLMNVGNRAAQADGGLVQAIAWGRGGEVTYALEAVIRTSGDSLNWVRDNLGFFSSYEEMERLLAEAPDSAGVYLVPAFVGLGAPYWRPDARAAITGMSRSAGRAHIVRAAWESIAYQVRDAIELLQSESGIALRALYADGGAADSATLMQFQSDLLDRPVSRLGVAELSAMGSAYMGGLAVGLWSSLDEIAGLPREARIYEARMETTARERLYGGWKRAVRSVLAGAAEE
jgi:glycerol kinase